MSRGVLGAKSSTRFSTSKPASAERAGTMSPWPRWNSTPPSDQLSLCIPRCARCSVSDGRVGIVDRAEDHERAVTEEHETTAGPEQPRRPRGASAYGSHQMLAPYSENARSKLASGNGTVLCVRLDERKLDPGLRLQPPRRRRAAPA